MNEVLSAIDFNKLIRPNFMFIIPILIIVGLVIKYLTNKNNKLIPVYLFIVAFPIAAVWGYLTSQYTGGARIFDTFIIAGLSQGAATTAGAVMVYASFHGGKRVFREWKGKKIEGVKDDI